MNEAGRFLRDYAELSRRRKESTRAAMQRARLELPTVAAWADGEGEAPRPERAA